MKLTWVVQLNNGILVPIYAAGKSFQGSYTEALYNLENGSRRGPLSALLDPLFVGLPVFPIKYREDLGLVFEACEPCESCGCATPRSGYTVTKTGIHISPVHGPVDDLKKLTPKGWS